MNPDERPQVRRSYNVDVEWNWPKAITTIVFLICLLLCLVGSDLIKAFKG